MEYTYTVRRIENKEASVEGLTGKQARALLWFVTGRRFAEFDPRDVRFTVSADHYTGFEVIRED